MTRLEKFLLSRCDEMIKSDTTLSRYYLIDNISVRVSDHISFNTTSDIQIITPNNEIAAGLYTVLFGNNGKTLIWNSKQIQEFLPSMILMKDMTTASLIPSDPTRRRSVIEKIEVAKNPIELPKTELEFKGLCTSKLKLKILSSYQRKVIGRNKTTWIANEIQCLNSLFKLEFGRGDKVNEDFQIFLNCTSLDYNDVMNIYKIVVIDNDKTPTIELLQEAYNLIK